MTKNRARVRATKELAQTAGLRHPDASYLADHRKLKLPDGTIHDFTTGPLRFYGGKGSGMTRAAYNVLKEADRKGWKRTNLLGKYFLDPERVLAHLRSDTFLVFLEEHASGGPDPVTEAFIESVANGDYPDLNVLVTAEALEEEPARGKNVRCVRAEAQEQQQPKLDDVVLVKTRIAFALRYADMNANGEDDITALRAVAHDLDRFGTPEAAAVAAAARSALDPVRNGFTVAQHFKAEHEELFGTHLVGVIGSAWNAGRLAAGLRDAAATIEADLRLGLTA